MPPTKTLTVFRLILGWVTPRSFENHSRSTKTDSVNLNATSLTYMQHSCINYDYTFRPFMVAMEKILISKRI